ncbi:uncharacterized protein F5Z01DRAFT_76797 [Emericellopsis atlantica]|uniref:Uncharacterized protein n=1 Tax=Emericellopsis atlantica TaxID=2614577 RepID=A0A9P8CRW4_9HYPO|nr:uncharacterized protein F5Z01DRAFT_76797 [Emericellopsis atlantica]KAG9255151.1 hypothetical protein F5Z01DRAFT_76797 [Emericellopsis atlantica]
MYFTPLPSSAFLSSIVGRTQGTATLIIITVITAINSIAPHRRACLTRPCCKSQSPLFIFHPKIYTLATTATPESFAGSSFSLSLQLSHSSTVIIIIIIVTHTHTDAGARALFNARLNTDILLTDCRLFLDPIGYTLLKGKQPSRFFTSSPISPLCASASVPRPLVPSSRRVSVPLKTAKRHGSNTSFMLTPLSTLFFWHFPLVASTPGHDPNSLGSSLPPPLSSSSVVIEGYARLGRARRTGAVMCFAKLL